MNNVSFNIEQFNDTIKKRLAYIIADSLIPPKRVNYPKGKQIEYQQPKRDNYPVATETI